MTVHLPLRAGIRRSGRSLSRFRHDVASPLCCLSFDASAPLVTVKAHSVKLAVFFFLGGGGERKVWKEKRSLSILTPVTLTALSVEYLKWRGRFNTDNVSTAASPTWKTPLNVSTTVNKIWFITLKTIVYTYIIFGLCLLIKTTLTKWLQ